MEIKFRPIEKVINDIITKCSDYCYNGWTLHAIGTSSDHKFTFMVVNSEGKEKRIEINQFEEDIKDA
ncbi:MAG: hypothetical protein J6R47_04180 [Acholeplasmatales bacterium]|nr:hypothetical protein [Acholeplasmatales bacterium]